MPRLRIDRVTPTDAGPELAVSLLSDAGAILTRDRLTLGWAAIRDQTVGEILATIREIVRGKLPRTPLADLRSALEGREVPL